MIHILQSYCIISTGVRITCSNQNGQGKRSTVLSTSGSQSIRDNIGAIFGPKQVFLLSNLHFHCLQFDGIIIWWQRGVKSCRTLRASDVIWYAKGFTPVSVMCSSAAESPAFSASVSHRKYYWRIWTRWCWSSQTAVFVSLTILCKVLIKVCNF